MTALIGRISFLQGKCKRLVNMPVYSELKAVFDVEARRVTTIVIMPNDKP